jgi:tetraacyldisaccharide 4'-kinase
MKILSLILLPLSWLYGFAVWGRNLCYDVGLFKSVRVEVPVISVGNMTAGGTGKTPFVEYLIRYYLNKNKKIAVLSRGYKRKSVGMKIVSDGHSIYGTALTMGDEPIQIAQKFPNVIVAVDKNRVRVAKIVIQKYKPDLILLDDGFQHRGIVRDLNIVMIDSRRSLSEIPMIPAGIRREPITALRRADFIVLTNNSRLSEETAEEQFQSYGMNVAKVKYKSIGICEFGSMKKIDLKSDVKKKCIAFCGIGNPVPFKDTLDESGYFVEELLTFSDHHWYDHNDMQAIQNKYDEHKVNYIITTEKDAVRLKSMTLPDSFPIQALYFIEIIVAITEGEKQLHSLLDKTIMKAA